MNKTIKKLYNEELGIPINRETALKLADISNLEILDLISLAHKTQVKYSPDNHLCSIMNVKSGKCPENCSFCAQSAHAHTDIETYGLIDKDNILKQAEITIKNRIPHFGIVTSGYGYLDINQEFTQILNIIDELNKKYPQLEVCLSLGCLSKETAAELGKRKISHYNHNLQVSPDKYSQLISTTHKVEARIKTLHLLKENKIKTCTGAIFGLGESMTDRIDHALLLKELKADVIPLNVLIPIEGTKMAKKSTLSVFEIAKSFALFRLILHNKIIKFAAGRETLLKDFQGLLMLCGINGMLSGGYLTTRGRKISEDKNFLSELEKFNVQ